MKKQTPLLILLLIFFIGATQISHAQQNNNAPISANAPADNPYNISKDGMSKFDSLIAPYVAKAIETLPDAKQKFMKGLNPGEAFFLTIRIYDSNKKYEQVFIRVKDWGDKKIKGTIASQLDLVKEYKSGQLISFTESDILDWLITKPDGSEEGNFVGKFMDTLNQ